MAATRIMPLHVGKGRTESLAISGTIDYVANPKKKVNPEAYAYVIKTDRLLAELQG